jgi:hypothetical protein
MARNRTRALHAVKTVDNYQVWLQARAKPIKPTLVLVPRLALSEDK